MKILERPRRRLSRRWCPMALTNLWGSFFSRVEEGGAMVRPFRRGLFSRVGLNVGSGAAVRWTRAPRARGPAAGHVWTGSRKHVARHLV